VTAAFFDLDNTLIRGSSLVHVVRHLVAQGVLERRLLLRAGAQQLAYLTTAREHGVHSARDRALGLVEGVSADELTAHCRVALEQRLERALYSGTVGLLRAHQDAGHVTFLATAAPVEIADIIAEALGMTGALGTVAERKDGLYTGALSSPVRHGVNKAEAVRELAAQLGIDLAAASAYSDSYNDLPLLALVGAPHAVNPDGRLRRHARAASWPVHDVSRRHDAVRAGALAGATAGALTAAAVTLTLVRRSQARQR
jgi:HAD superfamily hydrolase (TIGR01490 family)